MINDRIYSLTGYIVVTSHYMRRSTHTCKVDGILLSLGNGRRRGRCGREGRHFKRFRGCSEVFKSFEVVDLKMADQTNCGHDDKARFTSHLSLGSASTEGCDG
jgi:hypothetical protein